MPLRCGYRYMLRLALFADETHSAELFDIRLERRAACAAYSARRIRTARGGACGRHDERLGKQHHAAARVH